MQRYSTSEACNISMCYLNFRDSVVKIFMLGMCSGSTRFFSLIFNLWCINAWNNFEIAHSRAYVFRQKVCKINISNVLCATAMSNNSNN